MAEATKSAAQSLPKEYEAIYVLRPDIDVETAAKVANRVTEVIGREAGTLMKVESWGRRKLAYPVRKYRKGIYVYVRFVGGGGLVAEFERNLRMQKDAVIKFQTIKLKDVVETVAIKIDPEEIKFAAIEPMPEDERDESRERLLGLVDYGDRDRDRDRDHDRRGPRDDMMVPDDLDGDGIPDDDSDGEEKRS